MSRPEASERPGGSPVILAAAVINDNGDRRQLVASARRLFRALDGA